MSSENIDHFRESLPAEGQLDNARCWFIYRNSYISDIEDQLKSISVPTGQDWAGGLDHDNYRSEVRSREHELIGEKVEEQDPLYIRTFAAIEVERLRIQEAGEILFEPIKLEYKFALRTLREVLDEQLEHSTDDPRAYRQTYEHQIIRPDQPLTYAISRTKSSATTIYVVKEYTPSAELITTYGLTHHGQKDDNDFIVFPAGPDHPDRSASTTSGVLKLATSISHH